MPICEVCFRHCSLREGQTGFCGARVCTGGKVVPKHYGKVSAIALDPIEKKPLKRFYPGSMVLSFGSCGCNMRCPFCQNSEISWSSQAMNMGEQLRQLEPQKAAELALKYKPQGNIGAAFTYNEPLVCCEFVRDTARLVKKAGMKNVLVTNASAELCVLDELQGCIDRSRKALEMLAPYQDDLRCAYAAALVLRPRTVKHRIADVQDVTCVP